MPQITKLLIFMTCIVAASTAIGASGLGNFAGLNPQTGIQDDVNESKQEFRNYSASRQSGQVNFIGAVFSSAGKVMQGFALVFELRSLLVNLGVPKWAATFLASPVVYFFGLFFVYLISGRRTTGRM